MLGQKTNKMEHYSKLTENSYDIVAQKYFDLFKDELEYKEFDRELLNEFSSQLNYQANILDAGCGPIGHTGEFLDSLGHNVTGIDISEKCISIASSVTDNVKFKQMDMSKMNFTDNSFDGVISYYSIIHAPKHLVQEFFQEFNRVLKPGGKLLVSVKTGDQEEYIEKFLDSKSKIYFSHFQLYEIKEYFDHSNFKIILLEERTPYPDEIKVKRIFAIGEKL